MALSSANDAVLRDSIDTLKRALQKNESKNTNTFEGLDAILKRKRDG